MNQDDNEPLPSIERHIQSLIAVLIVGLIVWVGTTINDLQTAVAAMQSDLRHLSTQVLDLRAGVRERYTKSDATRDIGLIMNRVGSLAESVRVLRKRIDAIERSREP